MLMYGFERAVSEHVSQFLIPLGQHGDRYLANFSLRLSVFPEV